MKHVLVLGGGFAGLESAIYLRRFGYQVTLVSNRDYLYLYPLSIWIPTGMTDFDRLCLPLGQLAAVHGFSLVVDRVVGIEAQRQQVELGATTLSYDYLVVAFGGDKVQHNGQEHFLSICGRPEESLALKQRLDALIAAGRGRIAVGFGGNPLDGTGVRGGPAFELLFNFDTFLRRRRLRDRFSLVFFASMPKPGIRLGEKAIGMVDQMLKHQGIEKRVGQKIRAFQADGIVFEDGSKLDSDLTMFIPAVTGKRLLKDSDLPLTEAGFVKINDHCQVAGFDNVFAVGDVARIEGPDWRAKQGHLAEVMARCAAYNIHAQEQGWEKRKGYEKHLSIMCVLDTGNGAAFVYRDDRRGAIVPMPIVGHWIKKAWGLYYKWSKLKRIPRIPGL